MKYLRHKEKGILVPYNPSIESADWEVCEEPHTSDPEPEAPAEEPRSRKKPGPKSRAEKEAEAAADGDPEAEGGANVGDSAE